MWVQFLALEDLLEKEMATHSSILAWRIPWTEEPDGLQSMGSRRFNHDLVTNPPSPYIFFINNISQNKCVINICLNPKSRQSIATVRANEEQS